MGFIGRHEHSLDAKGRIILPARFRSNFDTAAFVSKYTEGCLALFPPDAFEQKLGEMAAIQDRSPADRAMVRAWASGSMEVELDKQGRVAIPGYLREYAHLDNAVLIQGAISHIELWDPGVWQAKGASGDDALVDPSAALASAWAVEAAPPPVTTPTT
jgi:MraZ protein